MSDPQQAGRSASAPRPSAPAPDGELQPANSGPSLKLLYALLALALAAAVGFALLIVLPFYQHRH